MAKNLSYLLFPVKLVLEVSFLEIFLLDTPIKDGNRKIEKLLFVDAIYECLLILIQIISWLLISHYI